MSGSDADHFEAGSHPLRGDKPGNAQFYFGGFCGVCMHQAGSPFDDAEPAEEFSLRDRPIDGECFPWDGGGERGKIYMHGQIGLARRAERVFSSVTAQGLQGLARGRFEMAIVDEECRQWRIAGTRREIPSPVPGDLGSL